MERLRHLGVFSLPFMGNIQDQSMSISENPSAQTFRRSWAGCERREFGDVSRCFPPLTSPSSVKLSNKGQVTDANLFMPLDVGD